jgi:membrane protease YdiL (CAAX protease family)
MIKLKNPKNLRKKLNPVDSGISFLGAIFAIVGASYLLTMIVILTYFAEYSANPTFLNQAMNYPWVIILSAILPQLTLLLFAFIFCEMRRIDLFSATRINSKPKITVIAIIPVLALFLIFSNLPLLTAADDIFRRVGYTMPDISFGNMLDSPWGVIGVVLSVCLMPALFEELIFRGLVLQGLASKFRPYFAIILSSLAFSLMHMSPAQTIHQFLLGIALGYIVLATKSIWAGVILHFFNNLWAIIFELLPQNIISVPFIDNTIFIYLGGVIFSLLGLVAFFLAVDFANKDIAQGIFAKSIKKRQKDYQYRINYDIILPPPAFGAMSMSEEEYKNYAIAKEQKNRRTFIILFTLAFGICLAFWILSLAQGILS